MSTATFPAEQYVAQEQQEHAATLGMWTFLASEILFFGTLFLALSYYKVSASKAFEEGSKHLVIEIGGANTAVLLTSSLMMAMAVKVAKEGNRRRLIKYLLATASLGVVFLCLKGFEYYKDFQEGIVPLYNYHSGEFHSLKTKMFFFLYFVMTGFHALHLMIAVGAVLWLTKRAVRGDFDRVYNLPVEITGLYWHFVDIVWIFLFPMLYLAGRS